MFVQNKPDGTQNHGGAVSGALARADEARLAVAYVRENGVDMILDGLKNKPVKLLCSFDMGITQLSGIRKLLENNVEVRVYHSGEGTFHPKVWLFREADKWKALVGSANMTGAAFTTNVEAGVFLEDGETTADARAFFDGLWNDEESAGPVNLGDIDRLREQIALRREISRAAAQIQERFARRKAGKTAAPAETESVNARKTEIMFSFIKNWIDIPKEIKAGGTSLWRGWYIIPDQGYVTDKLAEDLAAYLRLAGDGVNIAPVPDIHYQKILDEFMARNKFQRAVLKTSPHGLFVRQAKNYLVHFGWARHPLVNRGGQYSRDKKLLLPTAWGRRVAECKNAAEIKEVYSEYFEDFAFNGLRLVPFTRRLLEKFGYLDLDEFNYFVAHACNDDDWETVSRLISMYRECSDEDRAELAREAKQYFARIKGGTAANVYGNYVKKLKYTISAIGWCAGFAADLEQFTVRLESDADK